ncbi:MAG TPA: SDR family oxidoreductase, partial [Anaerolineaceae bacterium]
MSPIDSDPIPSPTPETRGLALVTGGAQRIGRAIALTLAGLGYAIALHYFRSKKAAVETGAALREVGARVELLCADLRDPAEIEGLFATIDALQLPLRVLVNSAGVMPRRKLEDLSVTDWDETLALNLRAPLLCAQAAARRMEEGGVIVNLTDSGARKVWTGYPAYVVSKSALETLTRLQARSLAPRIRVNAVAPGLVMPGPDTSLAEWERLIGRVPLARPGMAEE